MCQRANDNVIWEIIEQVVDASEKKEEKKAIFEHLGFCQS
jgi:hypothetical protein